MSKYDYDVLTIGLGPAGMAVSAMAVQMGLKVDRFLRTSRKHIFTVGDCNGHARRSHAAVHQGMIALINSIIPRPMKRMESPLLKRLARFMYRI